MLLKDKTKTTAPHGITPDEIRRLSGGLYLMEKCCLSQKDSSLYWAVIGDEVLTQPSKAPYETFSRVKSRLVRLQKREGLPQYWCEVLEVTNGLHSNLVFPGTPAIAERLKAAFPDYFQGEKSIQLVENRKHLELYLKKERTPQASYALGMAIKKGTYKHDGLGDRVVLSQALTQKAGGWKRTNSKRSMQPRTYPPRMKPTGYMKPSGQMELFPALVQPASRLKDYNGGILSPSAAQEFEYRRKRLGLSQKQLGIISGLSQPQIANAVHSRFGLSPQAASRLKQVLAA